MKHENVKLVVETFRMRTRQFVHTLYTRTNSHFETYICNTKYKIVIPYNIPPMYTKNIYMYEH